MACLIIFSAFCNVTSSVLLHFSSVVLRCFQKQFQSARTRQSMILSQDCVIYTEGGLLTETVTIYLFLNYRSRRKGFEIQTDTIFNASSSPVARRRRYMHKLITVL